MLLFTESKSTSFFFLKGILFFKRFYLENQDGGVGRHTAPTRTTRTDRISNSKEVRHQVDKKETYIQPVGGAEMGTGQKGLAWPWQDRDWQSVGRTGQAV